MNSVKHPLLRYCARGLVVVWMGTCTGCGVAKVEVKGAVTFDGQPLDGATIVLEPADGKGPTGGGRIMQGKYLLAGEGAVVPGKKIVRITAVHKTGGKHDGGMGGEPVWVDEMAQIIPAIYNQESTLTCEIVAGKANQHNFELKSQLQTTPTE